MQIKRTYFKIKFMIESEAYSELCQTTKVEPFAKIVNDIKKITILIETPSWRNLTDRILNMLQRIYSNYIQRALSIVEHLNQ